MCVAHLRPPLLWKYRVRHNFIFLLSIFFLIGCHPCRFQKEYQDQYVHLKNKDQTLALEKPFSQDSPYYLVVLVDARHLDYSNAENLLKTIQKHPDGSTSRDVGHVWIILSGIKDKKRVILEGGHSGELGISEPRYLESVIVAAREGKEVEPNPARFLFRALHDGYFEVGPGIHTPTYAIRIDIDEETFLKILWMTEPHHYDFKEYSLTHNQCASFACKAAGLAGLDLSHDITVQIPQYIHFEGEELALWHDPQYSSISISTPDVVEKSLIQAVLEGRAKPALRWYQNQHSNKSEK